MTMPTVAVTTTSLDVGTDSPASARADLLDAVQKLNQMIAHISTFAGTLLDDADAAAARTTLGAQAALGYTAANDSAVVKLTGNQTIADIKTFSVQPVLPEARTYGAVITTTGGTSIDLPSKPTWAKHYSVRLNGLSTSGTSLLMLLLGDAGGPENSGYVGGAGTMSSGVTTTSTWSSGAVLEAGGAYSGSSVRHGVIRIEDFGDATTYTIDGNIALASGNVIASFAGSKALSAGPLLVPRLTTVGGTDTFDAVSIRVSWW